VKLPTNSSTRIRACTSVFCACVFQNSWIVVRNHTCVQLRVNTAWAADLCHPPWKATTILFMSAGHSGFGCLLEQGTMSCPQRSLTNPFPQGPPTLFGRTSPYCKSCFFSADASCSLNSFPFHMNVQHWFNNKSVKTVQKFMSNRWPSESLHQMQPAVCNSLCWKKVFMMYRVLLHHSYTGNFLLSCAWASPSWAKSHSSAPSSIHQFRYMRLIGIAFYVATKTFRVLRGASGFLDFLVIPLSPPTCRPRVQSKHTKSEYILKNQPSNPALNSMKTIGCQPYANYLAKHVKPGLPGCHAWKSYINRYKKARKHQKSQIQEKYTTLWKSYTGCTAL